jgi:hypothetical protein
LFTIVADAKGSLLMTGSATGNHTLVSTNHEVLTGSEVEITQPKTPRSLPSISNANLVFA